MQTSTSVSLKPTAGTMMYIPLETRGTVVTVMQIIEYVDLLIAS